MQRFGQASFVGMIIVVTQELLVWQDAIVCGTAEDCFQGRHGTKIDQQRIQRLFGPVNGQIFSLIVVLWSSGRGGEEQGSAARCGGRIWPKKVIAIRAIMGIIKNILYLNRFVIGRVYMTTILPCIFI